MAADGPKSKKKSYYKPTGRPVGRPRGGALKPTGNARKAGDIVTSKTSSGWKKRWEHIYQTPVLQNPDRKVKLGDSDEELELSDLYSRKSKYTPEEKLFAVTAFVMTGSLVEAAKLSGVHYDSLTKFKQLALWWDDAVSEVRRRKQEELDGELTNILHRATAEIKDRIENGNPFVVIKTGEVKNVPLNSRELLFILSQTFEKRALIRGDPTSRTERVNADATLDKLTKKLEDTYRNLRNEASKLPETEGETFDAERIEKAITNQANTSETKSEREN